MGFGFGRLRYRFLFVGVGHEHVLGHAVPFGRHLRDAFGVLNGEVVEFSWIFGDVVEFPWTGTEGDYFPIAVAQGAVLFEEEVDGWPCA